ncbi:cobyrinic acid a,c-diamide synthase, partial [Lactobacillus sp. XV13L]|nr:cobyrinic acid a,c-diamide synthase [Lactobacillus sp. XV13L]
IDLIASLIKKYVNLDELLKIAEPVDNENTLPFVLPSRHLKLGIAQDLAFNFYYSDNLELLQKVGIELVPFSPLKDRKLPQVDALYFGGGYPEEFAEELAENQELQQTIKRFSEQDKPIYAECGGLMYLGQFLKIGERNYQMVGIYPGYSQMTPRLKKFGYCSAQATQDTLI